MITSLSPHLHHAYRIGITGPGGAGKSTLIDSLACIFRRNGLTVGIIPADPSSAFSGGELLNHAENANQI
jgi:LAO/AO transport system kinase